MSKDISNIVKKYLEISLKREDIEINVVKIKKMYHIHILVYVEPTDGLYKIINKGIDKLKVYREIGSYFDLNYENCRLTYRIV
jgi:hypothetical protein